MKFKYVSVRNFGCLMLMSLIFFIFSCGKTKEEQVREFAVDFAEKASKNQIDSLMIIYPGIEKADSVALKYLAEGIVIHPSEDGKEYEVLLNPDVSIIVKPTEDGSFTVTESHGLFAFSEENVEMAKKYDLWNTDLSDIEQAASIRQAIEKNKEEDRRILEAMPKVSMFGKNLSKPGYEELTPVANLRRLLMDKGYEKVNENKYVLNPRGTPCATVDLKYDSYYDPVDEIGGYSYDIKVTFSSSDDAKNFYKQLHKAVGESGWVTGSIQGNTVTISTYGD